MAQVRDKMSTDAVTIAPSATIRGDEATLA